MLGRESGVCQVNRPQLCQQSPPTPTPPRPEAQVNLTLLMHTAEGRSADSGTGSEAEVGVASRFRSNLIPSNYVRTSRGGKHVNGRNFSPNSETSRLPVDWCGRLTLEACTSPSAAILSVLHHSRAFPCCPMISPPVFPVQ